MSNNKKYGLLLPEKTKTKPVFQATRNIFGDDSDSDKESSKKPPQIQTNLSKSRQVKAAQEKVVLEDPTVYQYDEIYDSMTSAKEEKKIKSKKEKKPKYINNLIKSANKRKIENERRVERQIQKEREKEGDEFADKEVFVTTAYKKKLEELQNEEEKEKREEYLESIGDVTKQKDLGGFYRHLYEQKLGSTKKYEEEIKHEKVKSDSKSTIKRNYRKRKTSSDINSQLSDGEIEDSDEEVNRINLNSMRSGKKSKQEENIDADSDFSIDESSEDENEKTNTTQPELTSKEPAVTIKTNTKEKIEKEEIIKRVETTPPLELKPRIDPWKKRTVGEVFDQALKRYYERKAARGC